MHSSICHHNIIYLITERDIKFVTMVNSIYQQTSVIMCTHDHAINSNADIYIRFPSYLLIISLVQSSIFLRDDMKGTY